MDSKVMPPKVESTETDTTLVSKEEKIYYWRSLISFWIFGLSSSFPFASILAAAYDILGAGNTENSSTSSNHTNSSIIPLNETQEESTDYLVCNPVSTGVFLLVDIPVCLFVKTVFSFIAQKMSYPCKLFLICSAMALCLLLVVFSDGNLALCLLGFTVACFTYAIGDVVFLGLTSFYHKNVVSAWSSGTGASVLFGAMSYVGLTSVGLSLRGAMLCMLIIPALMMFAYFYILGKPSQDPTRSSQSPDEDSALLVDQRKRKSVDPLTLKQKFSLVPKLFTYMGPLGTVYFLQYLMKQGMHELLYFNHMFLSRKEQYRWYQVSTQLGVLIARSSVNLFHVRKIWIFTLIQIVIACLLFFQIIFRFLPSFWIVLAIALWEGLNSGATYVNTYYRLSMDAPEDEKEFSMGLVSVGDSASISFAGVVGMFMQSSICDMHLRIS